MSATRESPEEGFTLLEVLAVVLILGVLVAIAIGSYKLSTDSAKRVECLSNVRNLNTAVMVFEQRNGALPADIESLQPYVASKVATTCPADGRAYVYQELTGEVACPNHPQ